MNVFTLKDVMLRSCIAPSLATQHSCGPDVVTTDRLLVHLGAGAVGAARLVVVEQFVTQRQISASSEDIERRDASDGLLLLDQDDPSGAASVVPALYLGYCRCGQKSGRMGLRCAPATPDASSV